MSGRKKWQFGFVVALTVVRIPLILLFVLICVLAAKPLTVGWFVAAFAAMVLSAVTDMLDGWFARRFEVVTRFGAYFDPLTDKVFYLATLPTLVYLAALSGRTLHAGLLLGLTILFLLRDQWVSFLRSIGAIHGKVAGANWSGKLRTVIAFPVICGLYYHLQAPPGWWLQVPDWLAYLAEAAMIIVSLLSIWVYTGRYWPSLKKEISGVEQQ